MEDPNKLAIEVEPSVAPSGTPQEVPAQPEVSQEPLPVEVPEDDPFENFKRVADERFRTLQSVKDREVADAQKRAQMLELELQQLRSGGQQNQPQQIQAPAAATVQASKFLDLIQEGKEQEAVDMLLQAAEQRVAPQVEQRVLQQLQHRESQRQQEEKFIQEFHQVTDGYSEEEKAMAVHVIQSGFQQGRVVSPAEAAAIARFGSVEAAIKAATTGITAKKPAPVAPPPKPAHPPMNMFGVAPKVAETSPAAPGRSMLEGLYRDLN